MFLWQRTPDIHANTSSTYTFCRQKEIVLYLRQNEKQVLACNFFDKRVRVTELTENGCKIVRSITKQFPMCTFVPLQLLSLCNEYTRLLTQITKKKNSKISMILQRMHITSNSEYDMTWLSGLRNIYYIWCTNISRKKLQTEVEKKLKTQYIYGSQEDYQFTGR